MKKAVIFDIDGVILNSEKFYAERREQFFATKGIELSQEVNDLFIGSNPKAMMIYLFPNDPELQEEMRENYAHYSSELVYQTPDYLNPDVRPLLEELTTRGIRLAIASSGNPQGIKQMLADNQLTDYFEWVVSGEMFEESKPNPEIYQYTVAKLGLNPEECLVVEDSTIGITAAKAAGLEVLALQQTDYVVDQSQANARIASLKNVLDFL